MFYRLKNDTDFAQRVQNVFDSMKENGVMMEITSGLLEIIDTKDDGKKLGLYDTESTKRISVLPPSVEYKLGFFK